MTCSIKNKSKNKFPYEIKLVKDDENRILSKHFGGENKGYVQVGEEKWFFPLKYLSDSTHIYNFEVRHDDIWIVTFPRSGTTVTQELIWLLKNELNYEKAAKTPLQERFPLLEMSTIAEDNLKSILTEENKNNPRYLKIIQNAYSPTWEILNKTESPRFIKTHIPFPLLPPTLLSSGCKIVYVARNPKSVAVSYYHLCRLDRFFDFKGDFTSFWKIFEKNQVAWTPYWSHLKEGWKLKDHPNVQFLFYEDIVKDTSLTINKLSKFFCKPISAEQIDELTDYLKIDNFRNQSTSNMNYMKEMASTNEGAQSFIRNGKIGSWSKEFTPELTEVADKWISSNLANTDIIFPK